MKQATLAATGFEKYRKVTKREKFLQRMNEVMPWAELVAVVEPYYPKAGNGRRPIGVERMLRIYFLQHWYNLSDPGVEEALYDSAALRAFIGIDLGREPVPDETTVCKFRHLLEEHNLGRKLFAAVNDYLGAAGYRVSGGTIVDATVIAAPSSTKNQQGRRDPEMGSTKKGERWHFGMKLHVGVDSQNTLIHTVAATSASVHDSQKLADLLHGEETRVYGDSAYRDQGEVIAKVAPKARDFTQSRNYRNRRLNPQEALANRTKARVRAKVEHVFRIIKRQFGFDRVRYRGIHKNETRAVVACALANIFIVRNELPEFAA